MKINNKIQMNKPFFLLLTFILFTACGVQQAQNTGSSTTDSWIIESQEDWKANMAGQSNLDINKGKVIPTAKAPYIWKLHRPSIL